MMHRLHSSFTFAAKINEKRSLDLERVLQQLNSKKSFSFRLTLYVSGVILPKQQYQEECLPATFVFITTYCGPFSKHLEELINVWELPLIAIFECCDGFKQGANKYELARYLKSHKHISAFNSRYNCITPEDVEREKDLRNEIEDVLDSKQNFISKNNLTALQVKALIQDHIKNNLERFEWSFKADRKNLIELCWLNRVILIAAVLLVSVLACMLIWNPLAIFAFILTFILMFGLTLFILLKFITRKKYPPASRPPDSHVREISATQLQPVLNEMTAVAPLKPGLIRRHFYATALSIIGFFAPVFMNVPTVSTIRWFVVNSKKRLVFMPVYSNSTDFYVRDFLNGSTPMGVNFMFTNGTGFPDAELLFRGGIKNYPEEYMHAVHTGQIPTNLWHRHEPNLTADIINKNRKIRNGLFKQMTEGQALKWLKLL